MVEEEGFECGREILQQVKAISYLNGIGCTAACTFGIAPAPIPTDDLGATVLFQPRLKRFWLPVGQEVDHAVSLEINHDSAVAVTTAEGEVIDTQDARCVMGRKRRIPEES